MKDPALYHGSVFSSIEIMCIFNMLGSENNMCFPVDVIDITPEEEMKAISSLVHKSVLEWKKEKYKLTDEYRDVFEFIINCTKNIRFVSRTITSYSYLCYPKQETMIVWCVEGINRGKFVLYVMTKQNFIDILCEDSFLPEVPEYCNNIPLDLTESLTVSLNDFENLNFYSLLRIMFIISIVDVKSGEACRVVVSCDCSGSYISLIKDNQKTHMGYTKMTLLGAINDILNRGAWSDDRN